MGNLQYVSEVGGVRMDFGHDANNNTTNTSFIWVNPDNTNQTQTLPTATEFDAANRITRVTDPDGLARTAIYDDGGRVAQNIDRMGLTNSFLYDAMGNTVQTAYPDGAITRVVYDALSRALFTVDRHLPGSSANGTRTTYDSLGRVVAVERLSNVVINLVIDNGTPRTEVGSLGAVYSATTNRYDDGGRLIVTMGPGSQMTSNVYDNASRLIQVFDALGHHTDYEYDKAGHRTLVRDALQHVTQFEYDAKGRQIKTIFPDPAGGGAGTTFTSNTYNEIGQLLAVMDQAGLRTDFECDNLGRVKAVIKPPVFDPEGGTNASPRYEYEYDQFGNIRVSRDPKRRETKSTYDAFGQLINRALPLGQTETNVYNSLGQLWKKYDFKGQETEFVYDSLGRLVTNFLYAAGAGTPSQTNIWEYEPSGQYLRITRPEGITTWQYDLNGAVTNILSPEGWIGYEYDPAMGYMTRAYTVNSDIRYGYDELGRLKTVTVLKRNGQTINETTTYTYTALGNRESVTLPNSTKTTYEYDNLNRLTALSNLGPQSSVLSEYHYLLDATGHRTNAVEIILQPDDSSYITNNIGWTYDGMSRLTQESRSGGSGSVTTDSYAYDLAGNRFSKTTSVGGSGSSQTAYSYNANDQLLQETSVSSVTSVVQYAYDSNGSLTNKSTSVGGSGSSQTAYAYNVENRLGSVTAGGTTTSYLYDHAGIRVRSTTGTTPKYFLIDPNNHTGYAQVLEELSTVGATPSMSYVIGDDVLAQASSFSLQPSYLLGDGHGSTRQLLSGASHVSEQYNYDAYGVGLSLPSSPLTAILYSGEYWDSNAQQYYLRARYYDPSNGRFGAMDQMDGMLRDPQSLHKYTYCQNNPVNARDPSGNESLIELSMAIGIGEAIDPGVGRTLWLGAKLGTEAAAANESLEHIEGDDASPDMDTATIIIHGVAGVGGQPYGWSKKKFQPRLTGPAVSGSAPPLHHDFYEFDWGGFGVIPKLGIIPVKCVHQMAFVHLQMAQMLVWMKGYADINIISHSWGTTLSYDLLNSGGIEMKNWVTMGSPLNHDISKPFWNTGKWINCYSLNDPVVIFDMYPRPFDHPQWGIGLVGHQQVDDYVDTTGPGGLDWTFSAHTAYWDDDNVIQKIRTDMQ